MSLASRVVVAGAGSGKTWALVKRYLECLLGLDEGDEAPRTPDRLLAITFTDKAASEMRARIQERLADLLFAARTGDDGRLDELERELVARAAARAAAPTVQQLEALRRAIAGAPIQTFHAWCSRLLREHAIAAGLDPGFSLLEPADERRLLLETAEAVVLDALHLPVVAELCARVGLRGFGERNGLVECLVELHQTLAERGLSAAALLLAASENDATSAIERRLRAVDDCIGALATAGDKGRARMPAATAAAAALGDAWRERASTNDDDADAEARLAHCWCALRDVAGGGWGGPKAKEARQALVAAVHALGGALVDALTGSLAPAVRELLAELERRAAAEKDARGALGFGDLLVRARALLLRSPSIRAGVVARVDRVLVDEYQDTSPTQEDILALVLDGSGAAVPAGARALDVLAPTPGRAFLVGDAKQSVYSFRGADPSVLLRALARVGGRGELTENRRSLAPIVELANLIAEHVLPLGPLGTAREAIVPLSSLRGGEGAAGEHWLVDLDEAAPEVRRWRREEQEARVVAMQLRALVDAGELVPRDVCVLVRRGSATTAIARALGAAGIPATVVGGDGFFRRPEVCDVVSALTLAVDPDDELAVLTVLRSTLVAVPDDQLLALYQALPDGPRALTWPRALLAASSDGVALDVRARLERLEVVLAAVRARLHHEPLARALDRVLDDAGYTAACAVEHDAAARLANLAKLRELCSAPGESAVVTLLRLSAALDELPREPLAAAPDDQRDDELDDETAAPAVGAPRRRGRVHIMTIHQAKGLEFPVVVLADGTAGLKNATDDVLFDVDAGLAVGARGRPIGACLPEPAKLAPPGDDGLAAGQRVARLLRERGKAELARLLYVAVTRARDRLYLVGEAGPHASPLKLLEQVRDAEPARLAALLPTRAVVPTRPAGAGVATEDEVLALPAPPPAPHAGAQRVHASTVGRAALEPGAGKRAPLDRARTEAGRLAHGVLALVAGEHPELLGAEAPTLEPMIDRAARALGVAVVDAELRARLASTLRGPLARLVADGHVLSFEEPLLLEGGGVVVEGRADLVARKDDRTVAVDFKLGAGGVNSAATRAQLLCYAGALAARGEPGVALAAWHIGDPSPAPPIAFGDDERRALGAVLTAVLASPG
ncbi:MAG: UvrD-helicase domain-containing protein [Deltaproteobacteria bacterium]|nr:UvrD-helicase domain-containing protein [Deltaproteobacteria bacterium]